MADNITYDLLWQILQKEKQSNEIQMVPRTFFSDIAGIIRTLEKEKTEENEQVKSNMIKLSNDLYERRKQKILIYIAYGRQLPQPLPQEEVGFYGRITEAFKSNQFASYLSSESRKSMLESLYDIPEMLLPSGNKIGPLSKAQTIVVESNDDATFLINNALCKKIS
jgi:DNA replication initiation complex subunit (GINS family)